MKSAVLSSFSRRFRAVAATLAILTYQPAIAETVTQFKDTTRLVSIGGSLTEIVYALGAEKSLVARDQTSIFPDEAVMLKDVGYMRRLAPEGVLSVNPSGILLLQGAGPAETISVLDHASVPIVHVPENYSRDGIIRKIELVGEALGLQQAASRLAGDTAAQFDAVQKEIGHHAQPKRVLFVLSAAGGRLMVSGSGTAADSIIKLAGAVNAIDSFEGYKQLTDEAAQQAAPDAILAMSNAGAGEVTDSLLAIPALSATPAVKSGTIIRMDGAYLLGFGPRTAAAIRELSQRLYN